MNNRKKATEKKAPTLTKDQFTKLLKFVSVNNHPKRNTLIILFSYGLGLRAIEIAGLRICDVIDEQNNIKDMVELSITKNQKAREVFFVDKKIKRAIYDYLEERKLWCEKTRTSFSTDHALFLSQKGVGFTNKTMQRLFSEIYKHAEIKASSHSGRRTFATRLIENGFDIRSIQVLMGHSDINQTSKYIQTNPEKLKRITENALY